MGRFINADSYVSTGQGILGNNMFVYCGNNPVNRVDPSGEEWWHWALGLTAAVGAIALTVITLGAAAPAAACGLTMVGTSIGMSFATASAVATVAVDATILVGAAYAGDIAYSSFTGESVWLNTVFQGNEEAYYAGMYLSNFATAGMFEVAANSPGVCFARGTIVSTEKGKIPIEDISVGDLVFATDPETGEISLKEVVHLFRNETKEWIHLTVNDEEIICTPEHPFYSPMNGWTAACQLSVGDCLVNIDGEYVVVKDIKHELLDVPEMTYNFEVDGFHTYYVGSLGVLVHNSCRSSNKLKPDPNAVGEHIVFKRGANGEITNYAVYVPNSKNPTGFDEVFRFDKYGSHGNIVGSHVHLQNGLVRAQLLGEIPK